MHGFILGKYIINLLRLLSIILSYSYISNQYIKFYIKHISHSISYINYIKYHIFNYIL